MKVKFCNNLLAYAVKRKSESAKIWYQKVALVKNSELSKTNLNQMHLYYCTFKIFYLTVIKRKPASTLATVTVLKNVDLLLKPKESQCMEQCSIIKVPEQHHPFSLLSHFFK